MRDRIGAERQDVSSSTSTIRCDPSDLKTGMRVNLMLIGLFLICTVIITWPLALHPSSYVRDEGDPLLTSWILSWVNQSLRDNPAALFDPPVFYPEKGALAFSETLLLPSITVAPVFLLGGSAILANNLLYFLSFILTGWFFYLMCRELGMSSAASLVGAVLFDFAPFRMDFSHVQLSQVQYFPLQIMLFNRHFRLRKARYLLGSWLAFAATTLSCSYYGVYALLLMTLLHLFFLAAHWRTFTLRTLGALVTAPLPAASILLPYYLKYMQVRRAYGFERSLTGVESFGADLAAYATFFCQSAVMGGIGKFFQGSTVQCLAPGVIGTLLAIALLVVRPGRMREDGAVHSSFPTIADLVCVALTVLCCLVTLDGLLPPTSGIVAGSLTLLLAVWLGEILWTTLRRSQDLHTRAFAWIAALAFIASLGLEIRVAGASLGPGIYGFFKHFPGFWGIRAVSRISVLFFLCFFILSAYGMDRLREKGWIPRHGPLVVMILIGLELMNAPVPWVSYQTRDAEAYEWLTSRNDGGVVLELPLGTFLGQYRAMYESSMHHHHLFNGVSGFVPAAYFARTRILETYPSRAALDLLQGMLPLKYILWRSEPPAAVAGNRFESLDEVPFLRRAASFGAATIYEVKHDFSDAVERRSLRMYLDPLRLDGRELRLDLRPAVNDGVRRSVEVRLGETAIASTALDREGTVTVGIDQVPRDGAWLEVVAVESVEESWELGTWEVISSVVSGEASITVDGDATRSPATDGILLAATNGKGEKLTRRFIESSPGTDISAKVESTLRRLMENRYVFLATAGAPLRDAPEDLSRYLRDLSGIDAGRGSFVIAIQPSASGDPRHAPTIRAESGIAKARLSSEKRGFILSGVQVLRDGVSGLALSEPRHGSAQ